MRRITPYLGLSYFTTGENYSISADIARLESIEDSLDIAMKLTGGGVISGWNVYRDKSYSSDPNNSFTVTIQPGIGIVPIKASTDFEKEINLTGGKKIIRNINTPDPHYICIRTNNDIKLENVVGKNRITSIYAVLNNNYIKKYEELLNLDINVNPVFEIYNNIFINIDSELKRWDVLSKEFPKYYKEFDIVISPSANSSSKLGSYRDLKPLSTFPVHLYEIEGGLDGSPDNYNFTIYLNGKMYLSGFKCVNGNQIQFNVPLQESDHVVLKLVPKNGLLIAEIETNEQEIIKINNQVKVSIYQKVGDELITKYITKHIHDGIGASKILLTTESPFLNLVENGVSIDRKKFKFSKDLPQYEFDFNEGTFVEEVYIDGLITIDHYELTNDDSNKILTLMFNSSINDQSIVSIKLVLKEEYRQVTNKLKLSKDNPSSEVIDFKIGAEDISGILRKENMPKLSHFGLKDKTMIPCNPDDYSEDCVHITESFNLDSKYYKEFFPIYRGKNNLRNSLDVFYESGKYYSINKDAAFFLNKASRGIAGSTTYGINDLNYGWTELSKYYTRRTNDKPSEYNNYIKVGKIKNEYLNIERPIFFTSNCIYTLKNNFISEFINLTSQVDKGINDEIIDVNNEFSSIKSVCFASGLVNLNNSFYILTNNDRVYSYDYSVSMGKHTFYDITANPIWTNAKNIFNLKINDNKLLFVSDSTGKLYINYLSSIKTDIDLYKQSTIEVRGNFSTTISPYNTADESLIVSTFNRKSEKVRLVTVESTDNIGKKIAISTINEKSYTGMINGLYNTILLKDWFLLDDFNDQIINLFYQNNKIIIFTTNKIYYATISNEQNPLNNLVFSSYNTNISNIVSVIFVNNKFIIGSTSGLYSIDYNGSFSNKKELKNTNHGESLNTLLFPVNNLVYEEETDIIYNCSKWGIFISYDYGLSWKNSIQLLGNPVDIKSNKPKIIMKSLEISNNRIYLEKFYAPSGYGWGYGSGYNNNYFDVINPDVQSDEFGYGTDEFEGEHIGTYGYGYGSEIINPLDSLDLNDFVYVDFSSSSIYNKIPLRIIDFGLDQEGYFIDVEDLTGRGIDPEQIFINQKMYIYDHTIPLAVIDDYLQNEEYNPSIIEQYIFDYDRQSIIFNNIQDFDSDIKIISKYKYFKLLDNYDLTEYSINKWEMNDYEQSLYDKFVNANKQNLANNVTKSLGYYNDNDYFKITLDGNDIPNWSKIKNTFNLNRYVNLKNNICLFVSGLMIEDKGRHTHGEIEDELMKFDSGLPYVFDGIRNTNFLNSLISLNHVFKNENQDSVIYEGTIDQVFDDGDPLVFPYVSDVNIKALDHFLKGRKISIYNDIEYSENNEIKTKTMEREFTIVDNINGRCYIQRPVRHNRYVISDINDLVLELSEIGYSGSLIVSINNKVVNSSNYSVISNSKGITGIELIEEIFDLYPNEQLDVWVSYIDTNEYYLLTDYASVGNNYKIKNINNGIFEKLKNVKVLNYKDEQIIDYNSSFIENKPAPNILNNDNKGLRSFILYYLYTNNEDLFAATNNGVWYKQQNTDYFKRTGNFLKTINPIGDIDIPDNINSVYIEYNDITKIWTITWGGGIQSKDDNHDLNKFKINCIANSKNNPSLVLAGTTHGIYRSVDNGVNWEFVWNTEIDSRTSSHPEIIQIVFDDLHSWVVNAVLQEGVFRSYNYGDMWDLIVNGDVNNKTKNIYGTFNYEINSSDSRSTYFYIQNNLKYKTDKNLCNLSGDIKNSLLKGEIVFTNDVLFRNGFEGEKINKIINSKIDTSLVYLSSKYNGIFKSNLFGHKPDTYLNTETIKPATRNYYTPSAGIDQQMINDFSVDKIASVAKNQAFGDIIGNIAIGNNYYRDYLLFVDYQNNKTYISLDLDEKTSTMPKDGELIGYNVYLDGSVGRKYYKIIANYDRGYSLSRFGYEDYIGNKYAIKRIEIVLNGVVNKGQLNYIFNNYTYKLQEIQRINSKLYIDGIEKYEFNDGLYENWLILRSDKYSYIKQFVKISIFGEDNGSIDLPELGKIGNRLYAVKDDFFGEEKTMFIIDFNKNNGEYVNLPDFIHSGTKSNPVFILNSLNGYKIKTINNEIYNIKNSKILNSSSKYYSSNAFQIAIEVDDFTPTTDPVNIWFRRIFSEFNGTQPFSCSLIDGQDNYKIHLTMTDFNNIFGKDEPTVWIGFASTLDNSIDDDCSWYPQNVNDLIGMKIYNSLTKEQYEIFDAVETEIGDNFNDYNYTDSAFMSLTNKIDKRYYLRLKTYSKSYCDNYLLVSDGKVSEVGSNYIKLSKNGDGLNSNEAVGTIVTNSNSEYSHSMIQEIVDDKIIFTTTDAVSKFQVNDIVFIDNSLSDIRIKDMEIYYDSTEYIFVANRNNIYKKSGNKYNLFINGLPYNYSKNKTNLAINKLYANNDYLYAATDIGLYKTSITNCSWSKIDDSFNTDINDVLISGDYIIVAANNGIYYNYNNEWMGGCLPEDRITSLLTIVNDPKYQSKINNDLDRLWVGTDGRGLFKREKTKNNDLVINNIWKKSNIVYNYKNDIVAKNWFVRDFEYVSGLEVKSMAYRIGWLKDLYFRNDTYVQKYLDIDNYNVFDWEQKYNYIKTEFKNNNAICLIDPSNIGYVSKISDCIITSNSNLKNNTFTSFSTSAFGFGQGDKNFINNFALEKQTYISDLHFTDYGNIYLRKDIYEAPFNHLPERSSITDVVEIGDYLIVATDRNGIYRVDKDSFVMAGTNNNGFDFIKNNIDIDNNPSYKNGIKCLETTKRFWQNWESIENDLYYNLLEKYYIYKIYPNVSNNGYDQIDEMISNNKINNIIGSYIVLSGSFDDVIGYGDNSDTKIFEIVNVIKDSNDIINIKLSSGKTANATFFLKNPFDGKIDSYLYLLPNTKEYDESKLTRWNIDLNISANKKMFIIDFAKYEKLTNGLPELNIKNSKGEYECGLFIKRITKIDNDTFYLSCGKNGLWKCNDLTSNPIFTKEEIEDDVNCATFDGIDTLYIGTNNGVIKLVIGSTKEEFNNGLNHKYIWSILITSNNILYVGTENGGIYSYDLTNGTSWTREGAGFADDGDITRSQIYKWNIALPKLNDGNDPLNYENHQYQLAYSWGGGVFRKVNNKWEQVIEGLNNLYVQFVSICSSDSNVAYAATCGGGVYYSRNIFDNNPIWHQASSLGLPSAINIDKIFVGSDPNKVYISAKMNDMANENIPIWLDEYTINVPNNYFVGEFENEIQTGQLRGSSSRYYKKFLPHLEGDRKTVIFKGSFINNDISWQSIYDKQTGDKYFSSLVVGMTSLPNSDGVCFIYHYRDGLITNNNYKFVIIQNNTVIEKQLPNDIIYYLSSLRLSAISFNYIKAIKMTIDPIDTNTVYLSITSTYGEFNIYRSDNLGNTWENIKPTEKIESGMFDSVKISTINKVTYNVNIEIDDDQVFAIFDETYNKWITYFIIDAPENIPYINVNYGINNCGVYFDQDQSGYRIAHYSKFKDNINPNLDKLAVYFDGDIRARVINSTSFRIIGDRTIYANFNNNIYSSINKGYGWRKIDTAQDLFSNNLSHVLASVSVPVDEKESNLYALNDDGNLLLIYKYNGTNALVDFSDISTDLNVSSLIRNGLTFKYLNDSHHGILFISLNNKIYKCFVDISNGNLILSDFINLLNNYNSEIIINYPITLSDFSDNCLFAVNNELIVSENYFENNLNDAKIINLNGIISTNNIKKILIGTGTNVNQKNEVFICVNGSTSITILEFKYIRKISNGKENYIDVSNSNGKIKSGDNITFDDYSYVCSVDSILGIGGNTLRLKDTVYSDLSGYYFDNVLQKTKLILSNNTIKLQDYSNNVISLFADNSYGQLIYRAKIENFYNSDIYIPNNISNILSLHDKIYVRIGEINDILPENYIGNIRLHEEKSNTSNGLWYSNNLGNGLIKLENATFKDLKTGCEDVYVFDNGVIITIIATGEIKRGVINNKWISSNNVNMAISKDGKTVVATANGLCELVTNNGIEFNNYLTTNFEKIFKLGTNEYHLIDSNNNWYIVNDLYFNEYNGIDLISPFYSGLTGKINKIIKDSFGIYWLATSNKLLAYISGQGFKEIINGENIDDIIIDSNNRIWIVRNNNLSLITFNYYNQVLNYEIVNYNQENGLEENIIAVNERYGLLTEINGESDQPYVKLYWNDKNTKYNNIAILRSSSRITPNIQGDIQSSLVRVVGAVSEDQIIDENLNKIDVWKIEQAYTLEDHGLNTFIGKYILVRPEESNILAPVLKNETNIFYIPREQNGISIPAPIVNKNILISDVIDDAIVLYYGDDESGNYIDYNLIFSDSSINTYNYYLYRSNGSSYIYIDKKELEVYKSKVEVNRNSDIYCIGGNVLYKKNGFKDNFIIESEFDYSLKKIIIDSLNRIWLIGSGVLIKYENNSEKIYNSLSIFNNFINDFIINSVVETDDGYLTICSNSGLIQKDLINDVFEIYKIEDSLVSYRNQLGEIQYENWRVFDYYGASNTKIIKNNYQNKSSLIYVNKSLYESVNYGLTWNRKYNFNIDYSEIIPVYVIKNNNNIILKYNLVNNNKIYSISCDYYQHIYEGLHFDYELPSTDNDVLGTPSGVEVVETENSFKLIASIFNNNVKENECELVELILNNDSTNIESFTTYSGKDGLSIQTFFDILEDQDGAVYAAGKDNVVLKEANGKWRIIPFDNNSYLFKNDIYDSSYFNSPHVFTKLAIIGTGSDKRLFATRTPLYWFDRGIIQTGNDQYMISFNCSLHTTNGNREFIKNRNEIAVKYDLNSSFINPNSFNVNLNIPQYDSVKYTPYRSQEYKHNNLNGHIGCLSTYDNKLFIGGFNNSLYVIPFTNNSTLVSKNNISFKSGFHNLNRIELPLTNEMDYFDKVYGEYENEYYNKTNWLNMYNSYSLIHRDSYVSMRMFRNMNTGKPYFNYFNNYTPSSFDNLLRPMIGSFVGFTSDKGFASCSVIGTSVEQDGKNRNVAYINNSHETNTNIYISDRNGMIWEPYSIDFNPQIIVSGMIERNDDVIFSSNYGNYTNIGLFKYDKQLKTTTKLNGLSIPINKLCEINGTYYIGTNGMGIYTFDTTVDKYESRYKTYYGSNYANWSVTGIVEDGSGRIVLGTRRQGVVESLNSKEIEKAVYNLDDKGLPFGEITSINILKNNESIVLCGLKNEGLFRKDPETKTYKKITSGIPASGNVTKIYIDKDIVSVYVSININFTLPDNLMIIRTPYAPSEYPPTDGQIYNIGDEFFGSDVVFIGNGNSLAGKFKDSSVKLKSGINYYYDFYAIDNQNNYSWANTINGYVESREDMILTVQSSTTLSNIDLTGRLINLSYNSYSPRPDKYEITSNYTINMANKINVIFDEFKEINSGFWQDEYDGKPFVISSTIVGKAITINPVYVVFEENNIGSIYVSYDNGLNWNKINVS